MPTQMPECSVLIGEANPFERVRLERLISGWGYAVESFKDGNDAVRRLTAPDRPALALLDLHLPGMGCLEICKTLEAQKSAAIRSRQASNASALVHHSRPSRIVALVHPEEDRALLELLTPSYVPPLFEAGLSDILVKPIHEWELHFRLHIAQRAVAQQSESDQSIEAANLQVLHDPLTGLWTRDAVLQLLLRETSRVRREQKPLSLILIDLDGFSQRNVEFGYEACDSVLRQIAMRLRRDLRNYDILGRSGEDEFLIALPSCTLDDAISMAERLRRHALGKPFEVNGAWIPIRASFGVSESRGRLPLLVLREAERALVSAKLAGRNRVFRFSASLLENSALAEFNRGKVPPSSPLPLEAPGLSIPSVHLQRLESRKP